MKKIILFLVAISTMLMARSEIQMDTKNQKDMRKYTQKSEQNRLKKQDEMRKYKGNGEKRQKRRHRKMKNY